MIQIMKSLDIRHFKENEIIIEELDECREVLFVLEGKYNIGYQINNIQSYRKQFGPSTVIGGFQMCFLKRYKFVYIAHTEMVCYAIRRT